MIMARQQKRNWITWPVNAGMDFCILSTTACTDKFFCAFFSFQIRPGWLRLLPYGHCRKYKASVHFDQVVVSSVVPSEMEASALRNWKKNRIAVKVTAIASAIGSAI